ncbi:DUF4295 family protein [Bacteroidota bacterium]
MAKKVVAGLKKATTLVKVIRPIKTDQSGRYKFREDIMDKERIQEFLK